ncbi:Membrane associated serine protease, rhomboid family [Amphibacillus marinus]|uniref:Membrane associated serine protease, rhomboid family n=1 Tax=Amphibacillus marinus TaxID=872970 RepID=A0A1H8JQ84_9BACI|nr:rhomboid family intramembrane serine protease [Amphibacillus marinus]SEN82486.1 Membrane associated serine protease, rhomboid family [Amphibacillus marinus]
MFFRNESFKDFIRYYPVVSSILALQIIIWVLMYFNTGIGEVIFKEGIGFNYAVSQGEYWRLVTPIFLHAPAGFAHIVFNSFALVLFGPALEQMLGKLKFVLLYLGTGIIGNVFTYFVGDIMQFHLGASGAIYGLLGLLIYMGFSSSGLIDPGSRQIVVIYAGLGLVMTFLQPNINIAAHIFGFIGGLALGPILVHNVNPYTIKYRRRQHATSSGATFNPNRWRGRRFRINPNISAILWWIIIGLALLGFLSGFLF